MNNMELVKQYIGWALLPLYRECCPNDRSVTIKIDLDNGVVTHTGELKPISEWTTTTKEK